VYDIKQVIQIGEKILTKIKHINKNVFFFLILLLQKVIELPFNNHVDMTLFKAGNKFYTLINIFKIYLFVVDIFSKVISLLNIINIFKVCLCIIGNIFEMTGIKCKFI